MATMDLKRSDRFTKPELLVTLRVQSLPSAMEQMLSILAGSPTPYDPALPILQWKILKKHADLQRNMGQEFMLRSI